MVNVGTGRDLSPGSNEVDANFSSRYLKMKIAHRVT